MANRESKAKHLELLVVFDTNALFTKEAFMVSQEAATILGRHKAEESFRITWYLPSVVKHERHYRLLKRARELLSSTERLENLIRQNFNLTTSFVEEKVTQMMESQIRELALNILELDPMKVDWNRLILDACYRNPPFDPSTEKGLRDALIGETLMQLVQASPQAPEKCRIIFVSNDTLLADTIKMMTANASNVTVLHSLESLDQTINLVAAKVTAAEVTEELVARYQSKAYEYFVRTIYSKHRIAEKIEKQYERHLKAVPSGADERDNPKWVINRPRFLKKEGQRVFWATRIAVEAQAYKRTTAPTILGGYETYLRYAVPGTVSPTGPSYPDWLGPAPTASPTGPGYRDWLRPPTHVDWLGPAPTAGPTGPSYPDWLRPPGTLPSGGPGVAPKLLVNMGRSIFEVVWSVKITDDEKLVSENIERLDYIDTIWAWEA